MYRLYCSDLESACEALEEADVRFDLDGGNRIMTEELDAATGVLDAHGIDYDEL